MKKCQKNKSKTNTLSVLMNSDDLGKLKSFEIFKNIYINSYKNKFIYFLCFIFEMSYMLIFSESLFSSNKMIINTSFYNWMYDNYSVLGFTKNYKEFFNCQSKYSNSISKISGCSGFYDIKTLIIFALIIIPVIGMLILHFESKELKTQSTLIQKISKIIMTIFSLITYLLLKTFVFYLFLMITGIIIYTIFFGDIMALDTTNVIIVIITICFCVILSFLTVKFNIYYAKCYEVNIFSIKPNNYADISEYIFKLVILILFHFKNFTSQDTNLSNQYEFTILFLKIAALFIYFLDFSFYLRIYLKALCHDVYSKLKLLIKFLLFCFIFIQLGIFLILNLPSYIYNPDYYMLIKNEILISSLILGITVSLSLYLSNKIQELHLRFLKRENFSLILDNTIKNLISLTSLILEEYFYSLVINDKSNFKNKNFNYLDNRFKNLKNKKIFLEIFELWMNSHINVCSENTNFDCEFCEFKKLFYINKYQFSSKEESNVQDVCVKDILKFLSNVLDNMNNYKIDKNSLKHAQIHQILLKCILFYTLDKNTEKIVYYLKSLNFEFVKIETEVKYLIMILFKTLIEDEKKNEKNIKGILILKYIKLNERFMLMLRLFKNLITQMVGSNDSIKIDLLEARNIQIGLTLRKLKNSIIDIKRFKNEEIGSFLLYLTALNEITNEDIDEELTLSRLEVLDYLNERFHNDFYFIKEKINNNILIKHHPIMFSKLFKFEAKNSHSDTYFEIFFPYKIRNYQKAVLMKKLSCCEKSLTTNLYLLSSDGYLMNLYFHFEKLPIISEKVLFTSHIKINRTHENLEKVTDNKVKTLESFIDSNSLDHQGAILNSMSNLKYNNNLIIINEIGESFYFGKFYTKYLGFYPNLDSKKLNISFLFSFDFCKYFNNVTNEYTTAKQNIIGKTFELKIETDKFAKNYLHSLGLEDNNMLNTYSQNFFSLNYPEFFTINFTIVDYIKFDEEKNKIDLEYTELRKIYFVLSAEILDNRGRKNNIYSIGLDKKEELKTKSKVDSNDYVKNFVPLSIMNNDITYLEPSQSSTSSFSDISLYRQLEKTKKKGKEERISKIRISILICEILIVLIGLGCLLFINFLSSNILKVIIVSKDLIILQFTFLNLLCHDANSIKIGENAIDYEIQELYRKDFIKTNDLFFNLIKQSSHDANLFLDDSFVEEILVKEIDFVNFNGRFDKKPFFEILSLLSNQQYILSNKNEYYNRLKLESVFDPDSNELIFLNMNDTDKSLYMIFLNSNNMTSKFYELNFLIFSNLNVSLETFYFYVLLIFLIFCVLNTISVVLFLVDVKFLDRKIQTPANEIILVEDTKLKKLLEYLEKIDDLVNLRKKPTRILSRKQKESNRTSDSKDFYKGNRIFAKKTEKKIISNEIKENYKNVSLRIFSSGFLIILSILFTIIIIFLLSYFLINRISDEIKTIKTLNSSLINFHQYTIDFYLRTYFSILKKDPSQEKYLETKPNQIYQSMSKFLDIIENDNSLKEIKDFVNYFKTKEICEKLFAEEEESITLEKKCNSIEIMNSDYEEKFSFLIKNSREMYQKFLNSPRDEKAISSILNSERYQDLGFLFIFIQRNLIRNLLEKIGLSFYNTALTHLQSFSIIIFAFIILFKILISIYIRFYVMESLIKTIDNFVVIEKFFRK